MDKADDGGISDDELAALALSADPDQPVDPDAVPIPLTTPAMSGQLPDWYMPQASIARGKARRVLLGGLVVTLVVINGAGLCITYGVPEIAW